MDLGIFLVPLRWPYAVLYCKIDPGYQICYIITGDNQITTALGADFCVSEASSKICCEGSKALSQ